MTEIQIAQSVTPKHIREIAAKLAIPEEKLEYYGNDKAK
ncbi:MAG: formate--tetrahydrofolate ligase, partial [Gelidibacter sp.]